MHTVRNPSQTGEVLVTVHVYAPPLKDFRQFTPRPSTTGASAAREPGPHADVVVVGGGFSGSMTAAQILRRAHQAGLPIKVVLVERRGTVGEGVAYSTRESSHLLNVPAGSMSAVAGTSRTISFTGPRNGTATWCPPISFRANGTASMCASRY